MSNTPNMNLITPVVGTTPGPTWATDLNTSLTLIDSHDHSPGYGVAITPSGMNINADLPFNDNQASSMGAVAFSAQDAIATLRAAYVIDDDLYFRDGNNNEVRITQSGNVAGTPGSISGLVSPASASYAASTFVFQSNTNTAANIDVASIKMRNTTVSSYALTLNPPSAMGANIAQTLPTIPAATKIMSMDTSGNMYAQTVVDNSTLEWTSNTTLKVKDGGIGSTQLGASALALIPTAKIQTFTSNGTATIPTGCKWIYVELQAGGGGGASGNLAGGGAYTQTGGGGGSSGQFVAGMVNVDGLTTVPVTVGAGGVGGGASGSSGTGNVGTAGSNSTIVGNTTLTALGGNPGAGSSSGVQSIGGAVITSQRLYSINNAAGGNGGLTGVQDSQPGTALTANYAAGAAGSEVAGSGGGGGGGAGFFGAGGAGAGTPASGNGNPGTAASANTGGGGGGGSCNGPGGTLSGAGGAGGSGKVIVYYIGA